MKAFDAIGFDYVTCLAQVGEFEHLLTTKSALKERQDILPFFRKRTQLSALCSVVSSVVNGRTDRIAWEYDLFGDYACDLVVGDWDHKCYCFIEFEDATPSSLFHQVGKKASRDWSSRFEHGCSQTIDWIHKLSHMAESLDYEARFGKRSVDFDTVVIIGRRTGMDVGELGRFEWRRDHVLVCSKRVRCVTFDELLEFMKARLRSLELLAKSFAAPAAAPAAPGPISNA
jgi:hypothetical protein